MRRWFAAGIALLLLQGAAMAAPSKKKEKIPPELMHNTCEDCHGDRVERFRTNVHGFGRHPANAPLPDSFCEACHGDGRPHTESGGEASLIYVPYGREGAERACLKCHDQNSHEPESIHVPLRVRVHQPTGVHANSETVHCLTCHSIQHEEPRSPYLLRWRQEKLCAICHPTEVASFRNQPYSHRLGRGGMECSSCHDPHAGAGQESLRMTAAGELPCLNCHAEQRGPHAFEHGDAADGGCLNCHDVHGSSNPKMLKRASVAQLCIECHSPMSAATLGAQPPSFHNLASPRYQNCTTCHVKIHGSDRDPHLLE